MFEEFLLNSMRRGAANVQEWVPDLTQQVHQNLMSFPTCDGRLHMTFKNWSLNWGCPKILTQKSPSHPYPIILFTLLPCFPRVICMTLPRTSNEMAGQDSLNLWPWWSCMARALEGIQQGNHLGSLKTPFNDFETHLEWSWNGEDVTNLHRDTCFGNPCQLLLYMIYVLNVLCFQGFVWSTHHPSCWGEPGGGEVGLPIHIFHVSSGFSLTLSTFSVKPWEPTNHPERPQAFVFNVISAFAQLESKHRSTSRPTGTLRYGILAVAQDEGETANGSWEVVSGFTFRDWGMTSGWVPNDGDLVVGFQIDS